MDGRDGDAGVDVAVRRARPDDFDAWIALFEEVAAEARWIGTELPIDVEARRRGFAACVAGQEAVVFVVDDGGALVGAANVFLERGRADLGMLLSASHRGRGLGGRLLEACHGWAREVGAHKMTLEVWPHNEAGLRLYRRFGFVEEGRLRRHYRRRNGELWDAVVMGLVLDETSPGSPHGDAR